MLISVSVDRALARALEGQADLRVYEEVALA